MLPDKQTRLLAAYLDGELSGRQRKLAIRLLRKSPEARRLFRALQKDSRQLAALPPQLPPPDFTRHVVSYVAEQLPKGPATPSTLEPAFATGFTSSNWISLAVAASVLVMVTLASYLFFAQKPMPQPNPTYVDNKQPEIPKQPETPEPPKIEPPAPPKPLLAFELREFKKHREKLAAEFKREAAVQIELTTRNPAQATQNLKDVLDQNGVSLLDYPQIKKTMEALAKKQGKEKNTTRYFLFMEDLTVTQAAAILEDLAKKQQTAKQPVVSDLALDRISGDMRAQLATMLGISVSDLEPAKKTEEKIIFSPPPPEQPFVAEPKGKPADNPKHGAKQPKHVAVMLALGTDAVGGTTLASIRKFTKDRALVTRPDNTLQMVIELKQMHV